MYKQLRNRVKLASIRSYYSYINRLFSDGSDNKKRFFTFVRAQKKSQDPLTIKDNNKILYESDKIADLFGRYFNSVFTPSSDELIETPQSEENPLITYLSSIVIREEEEEE